MSSHLKNTGGKPSPPSGAGPKDWMSRTLAFCIRRDAATEFGIEGGLVVDEAILVERANDVGRLPAEREPGLGGLLLPVVRLVVSRDRDQPEQGEEKERRKEAPFHGNSPGNVRHRTRPALEDVRRSEAFSSICFCLDAGASIPDDSHYPACARFRIRFSRRLAPELPPCSLARWLSRPFWRWAVPRSRQTPKCRGSSSFIPPR